MSMQEDHHGKDASQAASQGSQSGSAGGTPHGDRMRRPGEPGYVADDEVEAALAPHAWPGDAEAAILLRRAGVFVLQAGYSGGSDQGYYEVLELAGSSGEALSLQALGLSPFDGPAYQVASVAVDKHLGGFSGSGDGTDYGGTVEIRLDTLQTREVSTYAYVPFCDERPGAPWQ